MEKIENKRCKKCGGDTSIQWIPSSGMDIQPTGMKRSCGRCGFSEFIKTLDGDKSDNQKEVLEDI